MTHITCIWKREWLLFLTPESGKGFFLSSIVNNLTSASAMDNLHFSLCLKNIIMKVICNFISENPALLKNIQYMIIDISTAEDFANQVKCG